MTREQLLYNICPQHSINICDNISCHDCYELLNCYLDSYDKHVIEQYEANRGLADTIRDIHDNVAREMYNKAVDDYMNKLCNHCIKQTNKCCKLECPFCTDGCKIVNIAGQLKEQKEE